MILSGVAAVSLKKSDPDFLEWFFKGSNDVGFNVD